MVYVTDLADSMCMFDSLSLVLEASVLVVVKLGVSKIWNAEHMG